MEKLFSQYKIFILIVFLIFLSILLFLFNYQKPKDTTQLVNQDQKNITPPSSFIESLRQRKFNGGEIKIEETLNQNNSYTSYIISYPSDNLKIYGMMNVPNGEGSFPVIILNHGYFNQSTFNSGDGTQTMADILARNGYLTLASDYRGFGKSENDNQGSRGHNQNYAIDVLNLIASIKNLEKADSNRIGMWGHSMGGEVSIRTAEVTNEVKVVVLWAPTSTNPSENTAFYGRGRHGISPSSIPGIEKISQDTYLRYINAPISINQGLADTEVDPEWSKNLYDALRKERKIVEYHEYKRQDHNFVNLGWDEISERTVSFFDKYLK